MLLLLLAFLGGALTLVSPCILPVLPFVFSRTGRPFLRSGLPLLLGMALTFAAVASLAAVGGGWAVALHRYGRWAALGLLAGFGLSLLLPRWAERLSRPLVRLGGRLSDSATARRERGAGGVASVLLGVATGLLWAPCAGPILGLILTGAALEGPSLASTLLLLSYALGAASSLALALLGGQRVLQALRQSVGVGEWMRRALGLGLLTGVLAIASGLDTGLLARTPLAGLDGLEQGLLERLRPAPLSTDAVQRPGDAGDARMMTMRGEASMPMSITQVLDGMQRDLPIEGRMPPLDGAVEWINSAPLSAEALRGKVVLVDFWTFSCINCLHTLPYVRAWADKYKAQGLVVIGVHAPEFAFEKDLGNVRQAVKDLGISYPVAVDNHYTLWRAFNNQFWPAHYFYDGQGRLRYHHFGEGEYRESEQVIQQLLAETAQRESRGRRSAPAAYAEAAAQRGGRTSAATAGGPAPATAKGYPLPLRGMPLRQTVFAAPGGTAPASAAG